MKKLTLTSKSSLLIFAIFTGVITPFSKMFIPFFAVNTNINILTIIQPFTALFLHYNWLHWLTNMFYLGVILYINHKTDNPIHAPLKHLFIIGTLANALALLGTIAYNLPQTYLIGASGGIFGLLGYTLPNLLIRLYKKPKDLKNILYIIILIFLMYSVFDANSNLTSNLTHISGIVVGLIYAILNINMYEKEPE